MDQISLTEAKKIKTYKVLKNIKNLPSIPKVIFEVTKLLNDPSTATPKLAEMISKDQSLTTKLLTIANSPLYGIKRKVSTIEFAILVLGFQEIKNIITALAFADSFKFTGSPKFNSYDFWIHSMVVGTAAKGISQDLGFNFGGDAFVGGILHDLGILVIYQYLYNEFLNIIDNAKEKNISINDSEIDVLGLTHQEIGQFLGEKWNLPNNLCDSMSFHHTPFNAAEDNKQFVAIIHLCDYMTNKLQIAQFYWDDYKEPDDSILSLLNFSSREHLDNFVEEYRELFSITASSIII